MTVRAPAITVRCMETIHATCIAYDGQGVLLRGPPGSGKSDLALRAIGDGAVLIADDRVALALVDGVVVASAPPTLAGLMEVRGVGILRLEAGRSAPVALVADLADGRAPPRLPEERQCVLLGRKLAWLTLAPFEASAAIKLRLALAAALDPARRAA